MVDETEALKRFLFDYTTYVAQVLRPAQEKLKLTLGKWRDTEYWEKYAGRGRIAAPSPIQRLHTRVKRPESVVDKILRKPESFPEGLTPASFRNMEDALGARVVLYFLSGVPLIDQELRSCGEFEISTRQRPVAYLSTELFNRLGLTHLERQEKESGYAAVHYILRLRNAKLPHDARPWFELQVRTIVEDAWSEIEHILGYKPEKRTSFAVRKQFKIISAELAAIDEHFTFLGEELSRFQEEGTYEDSDLLNAENLPPLLAEFGVGCAQREIDGLLKLLASRGVILVRDLRKLASVTRLEVIRNTYRIEEGRPPRNFEIVASLVATADVEQQEQLVDRIKAHIAYLRAWEELKRGFQSGESWEHNT